jgi:hypothetical protein
MTSMRLLGPAWVLGPNTWHTNMARLSSHIPHRQGILIEQSTMATNCIECTYPQGIKRGNSNKP